MSRKSGYRFSDQDMRHLNKLERFPIPPQDFFNFANRHPLAGSLRHSKALVGAPLALPVGFYLLRPQPRRSREREAGLGSLWVTIASREADVEPSPEAVGPLSAFNGAVLSRLHCFTDQGRYRLI